MEKEINAKQNNSYGKTKTRPTLLHRPKALC